VTLLLVDDMIAQIEEGGDELAQFGSHFFVLEIKGCKGMTKAIARGKETLKDCLGTALTNFQSEFSGLDWEYMMDRRKGELVCDVGITHHPQHSEPLVGLWRLDCLEASFGAAGYLKGDIHHLNTLAMYGGLQAEMSKERCMRTQVVKRISYNLAYEATRRMDNSRDLFSDKAVYDMVFEDDAKEVLEIYKVKAPKKSYGLREEFRVGGGALQHMMECVDTMV